MALQEWEKPKAGVIPKETGHLQTGKYGSDFSQDTGVLGVHDHREGQAGNCRYDPQLGERTGESVGR